MTLLTHDTYDTQKKILKKSCSKIRRAHFQCRIFAPDLKVKGPSDCRQTVVRLFESEQQKPPPALLRREWVFAPLGGAAATLSGCSEDPSRPLGE